MENVLDGRPAGPRCPTSRYGDVPTVDAVATHDPASGRIAVLAINRGTEFPVSLEFDIRHSGLYHVAEHRVLSATDIRLTNDSRNPNRVRPVYAPGSHVRPGERLAVELPPVSWSAIELEPQTNRQEN